MFLRLGQLVARYWLGLLIGWFGLLGLIVWNAPPLESVVQTGEFAFLPEDSPSRVAERLFARAFPRQAQASTIAVLVRRPSEPLTPADLDFVDHGLDATDSETPVDLAHRLQTLVSQSDLSRPADGEPADEPEITINTYRDRSVGKLLLSPDDRAALTLVELPTEFMDSANGPLIREVEKLLFEDEEFRQHVPDGLELYLSGTAVVGRDMLVTARDSAKATEHLTIVLVIVLLILIYRAPLLALVPLMTVFVSVEMAMHALCWLAGRDLVILFTGIESYVTVLLYGAGVDYCLFLIARYKEEIDRGYSASEALVQSLGAVGEAIAASAGTVICGIGMMIFAEFGKFHDAGIAITFGLVIVLLASLTFTPAMLRLAGHHVFWPRHRISLEESPPDSAGWLQGIWDRVSTHLQQRAGQLWLVCVAVMLPFAVVGAWFYTDLSYGLLTDLPRSARSVSGTEMVRQHFADGLTGPISVLIEAPDLDFAQLGEDGGVDVVARLTQALAARRSDLGLADVRSVAYPLGGEDGLDAIRNPAVYKLTLQRAIDTYVGVEGQFSHVTRLELISDEDPFSRNSIQGLIHLEQELPKVWEEVSQVPATLTFLGATASIRDLKHVTDRDQIRIDLLVTGGVFLILVVLIRQPGVCVYLIVSVLFSYLATLGVTYLSFWAIDGDEFAGLDWKVPMFLFTILIAVGEDYNIFLMSRVAEEQKKRGRIDGIIHALSCTGRIISSCGIIMAGTFASLAAGSLKGMAQLGFALAFGVLLDTFVVRPVLVPAYLVLLEKWNARRTGSDSDQAPAKVDEGSAGDS